MTKVNGVCWVLIRDGQVLLEKCPKKAAVIGVGEWFVPGGKLYRDETEASALVREMREEWPTVRLEEFEALPIVEGSAIPPGPAGLFLMRPYYVQVSGVIPDVSEDGPPLMWWPIDLALQSPVPQVRMMVAAATLPHETAGRF